MKFLFWSLQITQRLHPYCSPMGKCKHCFVPYRGDSYVKNFCFFSRTQDNNKGVQYKSVAILLLRHVSKGLNFWISWNNYLTSSLDVAWTKYWLLYDMASNLENAEIWESHLFQNLKHFCPKMAQKFLKTVRFSQISLLMSLYMLKSN